jgi:hypothetical protein
MTARTGEKRKLAVGVMNVITLVVRKSSDADKGRGHRTGGHAALFPYFTADRTGLFIHRKRLTPDLSDPECHPHDTRGSRVVLL